MMNKVPQSSMISTRSRGAFEIALLYLLIGILWIVFSDEAAAVLAPNQAALTQISIYKGWGYVLVTALLLYWMIRRHTQKISQAKLTLNESEKNYQELLQQASDGIFIADAQGQYTLVNEEGCRLVGYTQAELLSMNLRELIAPEDLQNQPARLAELQSGKTLLSERKLLRKDGSRIVCEISAKLLKDGRYQSIVRDITERKVTNEALLRSEQRYRSLFENMTNGFSRCQMIYENGAPTDFVYLDINEAFKKLTGLQDVIGKRVSAVIPGIRESNPELFEIYGRVAITGNPEKFETHVPGLGSGVWFSVSVYSTEKNFFVAVFEAITERKQAEAALRENEERLRLSLHAANQGLYDLNVQTGNAIVNREYAEMLGYDFDSFVETNAAWIERLHPDDQEITANAYADYIKGLTSEYRVEFRQRTKAGDWKWILSLGKVVEYDPAGKPLRMLGTHTDITAHKQAEAKLRHSEEQYRLMFTNNPLPMFVFNRETFVFLAVNDAAVVHYGYSREEFLKMTIKDIRPPEDIPAMMKLVATKSEPYSKIGIVKHRKKDGTLIDVEITRHDILFDGHDALIVLINDVTERKQTEEKILDSELRYRRLFESAKDGILILNAETGLIVDVNPFLTTLLGYPYEYFLGKRLWELGFFKDIVANEENFQELLQKKYIRYEDLPLESANGKRMNVEFVSNVYQVDHHKVVQCNIRDITDRKQAEAAQLQSEQKFSTIFKKAPFAATLSTFPEGIILEANEEFERLFGYPLEDVIGRTSLELNIYPEPDTRARMAAEFKAHGFTHNVELKFQTKSGNLRHLLVNTDFVELAGKKHLLTTAQDITERKQTEAIKSQLAAIVDSSEDAIIGKTLEGVITSWNIGAERLYGYSAAEAIGQPISLLIPSDRQDELPKILAQLKRGESIKYFETERQRKDGTRLFVSLTISPIKDAIGQITGASTIARDITDRKRAEKSVRESQELFLKAFRANPAAMVITRLADGTIIDLNASYEQIFEYSRDELIGKTSMQANIIVQPEERNTIVEKLQADGHVYGYETTLRARSGKLISALFSIEMIEQAGEQCMLSIIYDFTERRQAEDELRQSEENFAKAFISNPAAIAITRLADGKFININPAYTRIMEYEPNELLGHTAAEMNIYVHPEERDQVIRQLREQGNIQNYELQVRTKAGDTRRIVISMEPIVYNQEKCILTVFIDISERQKMEAELRRSNAELEQFAYVASHDLQEPLRAVAGMVQLLGQRYQGKLDERADEYIGHAVEASTRMQKLINDLLDYSRVNRLGRSFESTAVERSLNTALANLQLAIQESQAQITHDPLPTLMADAVQLTQLLQNLIGNAIKFRGERPLHIHLGAKKIEQAWQFSVSDNGIGIDPKYFERIFLVFQRLHTRREYPGTGIGLALCKKIIERHSGEIWVESQPGLGSTFYFTIPERQP